MCELTGPEIHPVCLGSALRKTQCTVYYRLACVSNFLCMTTRHRLSSENVHVLYPSMYQVLVLGRLILYSSCCLGDPNGAEPWLVPKMVLFPAFIPRTCTNHGMYASFDWPVLGTNQRYVNLAFFHGRQQGRIVLAKTPHGRASHSVGFFGVGLRISNIAVVRKERFPI